MAADIENQRFVILLTAFILNTRVVVLTSRTSCVFLASILAVAIGGATYSCFLVLWWCRLSLLKLSLRVAHSQCSRPTLWYTSPTTLGCRFIVLLRCWRLLLLLFLATFATALSVFFVIVLIWLIYRSPFVRWKSCRLLMQVLLLIRLPLLTVMMICIVGALALYSFLLA